MIQKHESKYWTGIMIVHIVKQNIWQRAVGKLMKGCEKEFEVEIEYDPICHVSKVEG
jgi:hypothetical protein